MADKPAQQLLHLVFGGELKDLAVGLRQHSAVAQRIAPPLAVEVRQRQAAQANEAVPRCVAFNVDVRHDFGRLLNPSDGPKIDHVRVADCDRIAGHVP